MEIFCYGCKTKEETDFLVRCSHCDSKGSIGIEESKEWNEICRLWAFSKGWQGDGDQLSLPWWFEGHPQSLLEWQRFKSDLMNPEYPPLPEVFMEKEDFFHHWIKSSGVLPLQMGNETELLHSHSIGPLVRQLAGIYADHHYSKRHGGVGQLREQAEREKSLLKKRARG